MRRETVAAALMFAWVWGAAIQAATDQIPSQFTNLQVLPAGMSRPELIQTMRQITRDLGVRCTHCHVGPDNLQGMDFASDEKAAKRAARTMLRMTQGINASFVSTLPAGAAPVQTVTCVTCHRGLPEPPRPLTALLLDTVAAGGPQAAIDQHRKLRDELPEAGLYDFREATLDQVAARLREERKFAEALALLKRNSELFPKSSNALVAVGLTALEMQDAATAEQYFRKALELDPAHAGALRGLAAIKR